ncbi:MAG: RHS repeat-associated core domain-containing protein [Fluviicola sp.]
MKGLNCIYKRYTYELTNHLGNVLSVISDKVIPHPSGASVAYYKADIMQAMDYSPFGVTLKGRNLKKTGLADLYRYGITGMEKDDEMKGDGNSYDFGARMLDPRLGRWLTIDPLASKYPYLSTYSFVNNSPLLYIDPNGKEIIINYKDEQGNIKSVVYTPGVKPLVDNKFVQQVHESIDAKMNTSGSSEINSISISNKMVVFQEIETFDNSTLPILNANGGVSAVVISWCPNIASETNDGGGQSPSTILYHEICHAERLIKCETKAEYDQMEADRIKQLKRGTSVEEGRVIVKESKAVSDANKNAFLNTPQCLEPTYEGTRQGHDEGKPYNTTSSTSIVNKDKKNNIKNSNTKTTRYWDKYQSKSDNTKINNIIKKDMPIVPETKELIIK